MKHSSNSKLIRCFGCGGMFPGIEGPTHRYMESVPGCWAAYGDVLAKQYSDANYSLAGQLTVDAYAVQHPGTPSPQSIQSVALHLVSLCLMFEHGVSPAEATLVVARTASDKSRFVWLPPPAAMGDLNVGDVRSATSASEHVARVREWAESAWHAWRQHYDTIRRWLPQNLSRPSH